MIFILVALSVLSALLATVMTVRGLKAERRLGRRRISELQADVERAILRLETAAEKLEDLEPTPDSSLNPTVAAPAATLSNEARMLSQVDRSAWAQDAASKLAGYVYRESYESFMSGRAGRLSLTYGEWGAELHQVRLPPDTYRELRSHSALHSVLHGRRLNEVVLDSSVFVHAAASLHSDLLQALHGGTHRVYLSYAALSEALLLIDESSPVDEEPRLGPPEAGRPSQGARH